MPEQFLWSAIRIPNKLQGGRARGEASFRGRQPDLYYRQSPCDAISSIISMFCWTRVAEVYNNRQVKAFMYMAANIQNIFHCVISLNIRFLVVALHSHSASGLKRWWAAFKLTSSAQINIHSRVFIWRIFHFEMRKHGWNSSSWQELFFLAPMKRSFPEELKTGFAWALGKGYFLWFCQEMSNLLSLLSFLALIETNIRSVFALL